MEKPDLEGVFKNCGGANPINSKDVKRCKDHANSRNARTTPTPGMQETQHTNSRDARTTPTIEMQGPLRERQKTSCIHLIHKLTELVRTLAMFSPEYRDALQACDTGRIPCKRAHLINLAGKIVTSCFRVNRSLL